MAFMAFMAFRVFNVFNAFNLGIEHLSRQFHFLARL